MALVTSLKISINILGSEVIKIFFGRGVGDDHSPLALMLITVMRC